MATFGYAQLPVPGGGDAPTTPGDLAELATAIDPHLWQHATNKADRDSRFSAAPIHTVVTADDGSVWVKTSSSNVWATIWEPLPAWQPIALASGIGQSGDVVPAVRVIDNRVHILGAVNKNDGSNFSGDAIKVATVPASCIPPQLRRYPGSCSLSGDTTDAACRIEVVGQTGASPGDVVVYYQATGGTPWIDLTGSYWMDGLLA